MENNILRPTFTNYILKKLINGESINVYGTVDFDEYSCKGIGIGKSRLVEDLVLLAPTNIISISLDMNNYRFGKSFDKFLDDISKPLGNEVFKSFGAFIEGVKEKKVMLLIDNFHYFFDNDKKDTRFDAHFIDNLNSAHNKVNISILVMTNKPHTNYNLCVGNGDECRASWLVFEDIEVSELTHGELSTEVNKVFPTLTNNERVTIVGYLNGALSIAIIDKLKQLLDSGQSIDNLEILVKVVQKSCKKRYTKGGNIWLERLSEFKTWIPFLKGD
ncbi:MAG TPA: hypothetical protein EYG85_08045 [Crocinitomix sp.]|nr:hypothetical protein [Crocinitomix sp.]